MKYCSKCGAQIPEGARFCKQCGTPVANAEKPAYAKEEKSNNEEKSNTVKIIIITLVVALLIGGGLFWFFNWNKTKGEDHHHEMIIGDSAVNSKEMVAQAAEAQGNLAEALGAIEEKQQESAQVNEPTDAVPGIVHYMHTDEYPNAADMRWYTADVMRNGVPAGVNRISSLEDAMDGWKGIIYNDLGNKFNSENIEFVNINIAGTEANLKARITTFAMFDVATEEVTTFDNDVEVYTGKWQNGKIRATGAGTINITDMWEKDNHQYAVGTFDSPDGVPALVAMVRSARVY